MLSKLVVAAALPVLALAQTSVLGTFRATIPGSLHQCEATNLFFFDSNDERPLTVLFIASSDSLSSIRGSDDLTLDSVAAQFSALQVLEVINTADASEYDFTLEIIEGQAFEVFGFLPDGSGKDLSLTRTVTTPLPAASSCISVSTTVADAAITSGASSSTSSSSSTSTSKASTSSSSSSSSSSKGSTSSTSSSSSTRTTSSATSTATSSSSSSASTVNAAVASSSSSSTSTSTSTSGASSNTVVSAVSVLFLGLAALAML